MKLKHIERHPMQLLGVEHQLLEAVQLGATHALFLRHGFSSAGSGFMFGSCGLTAWRHAPDVFTCRVYRRG